MSGALMIQVVTDMITIRRDFRRCLDMGSLPSLVVLHFGKEIIAKELQVDEGHPDVHRSFLAVYKSFMEYDTDQPPRYVNNTHLSSRVGRLNLDWIQPEQSPEKENKTFQKAMALAGSEFLDSVRYHARSWSLSQSIVMECPAARFDVDPGGEIMVLDTFCLEELNTDPSIKYVLYQICQRESGIPGSVFVHMSGFTGGNQTYEGALTMSRTALKTEKNGLSHCCHDQRKIPDFFAGPE
ncbi:hypothetical protein P3X46_030223 [Hevea brasiliensis]|uniref:Uncharacterized protein n=1 Tax=Hevea brasiliensis TaxID=3981 RepID=A0ABQ9KUQ8_HEVBR|nr:hypothetical protein P3X46_030223 [Hevea brasiliensis]